MVLIFRPDMALSFSVPLRPSATFFDGGWAQNRAQPLSLTLLGMTFSSFWRATSLIALLGALGSVPPVLPRCAVQVASMLTKSELKPEQVDRMGSRVYPGRREPRSFPRPEYSKKQG
jgi:hypothetical protein